MALVPKRGGWREGWGLFRYASGTTGKVECSRVGEMVCELLPSTSIDDHTYLEAMVELHCKGQSLGYEELLSALRQLKEVEGAAAASPAGSHSTTRGALLKIALYIRENTDSFVGLFHRFDVACKGHLHLGEVRQLLQVRLLCCAGGCGRGVGCRST